MTYMYLYVRVLYLWRFVYTTTDSGLGGAAAERKTGAPEL